MPISRSTLIIFAAICGLVTSYSATAQTPTPADEASWADLTDDQSRQMLFDSNVIPAKLKEDQATNFQPSTTELGIPKEFLFPDDARTDKTRVPAQPRTGAMFGVDIS